MTEFRGFSVRRAGVLRVRGRWVPMCVTCDRGYSLESTGCPFNPRGEQMAGRAAEESQEVRACFLCRAGSRVYAVCCPSLYLSLSFFLFSLSNFDLCSLAMCSEMIRKCFKGQVIG